MVFAILRRDRDDKVFIWATRGGKQSRGDRELELRQRDERFIDVHRGVRRAQTARKFRVYNRLSPSPSLDLTRYDIASLCTDTLLLAPSRPLIMTKPCFT